MSRLIGAVLFSLAESLPDIKNSVDEDHVSVVSVVGVYPSWAMSEQDLLLWFHHKKLVALGVITDGVLIPNPTEGYDVGYGYLIKSRCPVAF